MRHLLLFLLSLVGLAMPVHAQQGVSVQNLTTQATNCGNPPANSSGGVAIGIGTAGGATITLSGTWSGTVSFLGSGDGGATWTAVTSINNSGVSSAASNGTWQFNPSAYTHFCAAFTTATSGTVAARILLSVNSAGHGGGSGGGGGGSIGGTVTATHIPYASGVDTLSDSLLSYTAPGGNPAVTWSGSSSGDCIQSVDAGADLDLSGCPTITFNGAGADSGNPGGTFFFVKDSPAIGVDQDDLASDTFWQVEPIDIGGGHFKDQELISGANAGAYDYAETCWGNVNVGGYVACVRSSDTGNVAPEAPVEDMSPAATLTGTGACATNSTQTGGSLAGRIQCTGTTGASTLVITPSATAAHGWACYASDTTTLNTLRQIGANSTTACTISGVVNSNDQLTFIAVAF